MVLMLTFSIKLRFDVEMLTGRLRAVKRASSPEKSRVSSVSTDFDLRKKFLLKDDFFLELATFSVDVILEGASSLLSLPLCSFCKEHTRLFPL
mmetsp:Transcript_8137/g.18212  ORF Transcript_8137/g.18212 Transcript_8137/m.18212 type:complete len:93 (+) Transcript_8137:332-610(+)